MKWAKTKNSKYHKVYLKNGVYKFACGTGNYHGYKKSELKFLEVHPCCDQPVKRRFRGCILCGCIDR